MLKVLVLTAIQEEYAEARSYLSEIEEIILEDGTIIEKGVFSRGSEAIVVHLGMTGMGNIKSALISNDVIKYLNPDHLFYVGIAGGIKDLSVGDVLIAEKFYYMERGKVAEVFLSRPEASYSSHKILERARVESMKDDWKDLCKTDGKYHSKVKLGNICSGEKMIATNDQLNSYSKLIREHYSDSHAIDMESGGLIGSGWLNSFANLVIVRGISDLLADKDETEEHGGRADAINHAVAFTYHLISKIQPKAQDVKEYAITFNAEHGMLGELEYVMHEIQRITGDKTISIKMITKGSINLHLTGSKEGYDKLLQLFESGELKSIAGFEVERVAEMTENSTLKPVENDDLYAISRSSDKELRKAVRLSNPFEPFKIQTKTIRLKKQSSRRIEAAVIKDMWRYRTTFMDDLVFIRSDNEKSYIIVKQILLSDAPVQVPTIEDLFIHTRKSREQSPVKYVLHPSYFFNLNYQNSQLVPAAILDRYRVGRSTPQRFFYAAKDILPSTYRSRSLRMLIIIQYISDSNIIDEAHKVEAQVTGLLPGPFLL